MKAAWLLKITRAFTAGRPPLENLAHADAVAEIKKYLADCPHTDVVKTFLWARKAYPQVCTRDIDPPLSTRVPELDYYSVIKIKHRARPLTVKLASALEARAIALLQDLSELEIVTQLKLLTMDRPKFRQLLVHTAERLEQQPDSLPADRRVQALLSFFLANYPVPKLDQRWVPELVTGLSQLRLREIEDLMLIYGETKHTELMREVENHAVKNVGKITQNEIGALCSASSRVLPEYKSKLLPTLEDEIVLRAKTERFLGYNISKIFQGFIENIDRVAAALEPHIQTDFEQNEIAMVIYSLGINKKGSEETWKKLIARMKEVLDKADARSIAQGAYGAFHGGVKDEAFFGMLANAIGSFSLTIKVAEKLIPVYTAYRRPDVIIPCSECLLRDHSKLSLKRAITLIIMLKKGDFMNQKLFNLLRRLNAGEQT